MSDRLASSPHRLRRHLLAAVLLLLAAGAPAVAAAGRWSPFGPPEGALLALAFGPGESLFLAAQESGVYLSRDGGRTWGWSGTGMGSARVRAVANDAASRTLVAATDTAVFRSADGGASWQPLATGLDLGESPDGGDVLAVGPGARGDLFLGRGNRLSRGRAGGAGTASWQEVLTTDTPILSLLVDPASPLSVFAGTAQPGALFHSADGGTTWAPVTDVESLPGPPRQNPFAEDVRQLSALPGRPGVLLANAALATYLSTDGGASWRRIRTVPAGSVGYVYSVVGGAAARNRAPAIYALHQIASNDGFAHFGLFSSRDLGATWQRVDDGSAPNGSLRIDPATGALFALSIDGIERGDAAGTHWQSFLIGSQFCGSEAVGPAGTVVRFPAGAASRIYSVSGERLFVSDDSGGSWRNLGAALSSANLCIRFLDVAPDPRAESHLFAMTDHGLYASGDSGETWQPQSDTPIGTTLAVLPHGGLLNGDCGVQRSVDGGRTWSQNLGCDPGLGVDSERDVWRLIVDPARPGAIYAEVIEEGDGHPPVFVPRVFRSLDNGITWSLLFDGASIVAFDPRAPRTLYVLAPGGLQKSVDDGLTWTTISDFALSTGDFGVQLPGDLQVDPASSSVLWAAWPDGVFRSADGGVTWSPQRQGLQGRPGNSLFADPRHPGHWIVATGLGTFAATFPPLP